MKIKNITKLCVFESGVKKDFNINLFHDTIKRLPEPNKNEYYKLQLFKVKRLLSSIFVSFAYGALMRIIAG